MVNIEELVKTAIDVRKLAYAPYSNYLVGAALLSKDNRVFAGCNVENGVHGLSICAERVALTQAISHDVRQFSTIVIAADPLATPCGSCRQFLIEFGEDIKVISVDATLPDNRISWTSGELLPDHFELR